jgi:hypothetical protein
MRPPIWVHKCAGNRPPEAAACRNDRRAETRACEQPNLGLGFLVTVTAALLFYGALGALVRLLS